MSDREDHSDREDREDRGEQDDQGEWQDPALKCTDLIIVCCHGTYIGDGTKMAEDQWLLQPFQKSDSKSGKRSEHETMLLHLHAGAELAEANPRALLVMSGGRTTHQRIAEGRSYADILLKQRERYPRLHRDGRWLPEMNSTDSYQNLLFSIAKFHERTQTFPTNITVITHAFKERRFLELHAPAIKWPASQIRVLGINPPFSQSELLEAQEGEAERAYAPFVKDPYGAQGSLAAKREARNWKPAAIESICDRFDESFQELFRWNGGSSGTEIFPGPLPWAQ